MKQNLTLIMVLTALLTFSGCASVKTVTELYEFIMNEMVTSVRRIDIK